MEESKPESGIPEFQIRRMVRSSRWAAFLWHPLLAAFGLAGYFGLFSLFWEDSKFLLVWRVLAIMAPLMVFPQMKRHLECRLEGDRVESRSRCSPKIVEMEENDVNFNADLEADLVTPVRDYTGTSEAHLSSAASAAR